MLGKNISTAPSFISQAQVLVPIMHRYLSGDPNKKIAISVSSLGNKNFIIPYEQITAECITLENFLITLDERIQKEFIYREEIMQLKNSLCEEFSKLSDKITDEDFIKFMRDQSQRIINSLIEETKIEQIMIAEQFYNDMMNGWGEKALGFSQFSVIVNTVLREPLLTPLPIRALSLLKGFIGKLENERSNSQIEDVVSQLIIHIKNHLEAKLINVSNFKTIDELRMLFEEMIKERKICNVEAKDFAKSDNIINEFLSKCIKKVTLIRRTDEFLNEDRKLNYNELKLFGELEEPQAEWIFKKVQKNIASIKFYVGENIDYEKMKTFFSNLQLLTDLGMSFEDRQIGEEGAKLLSNALKELKNISSVDLNVKHNYIGLEGTKAISSALSELKSISILKLTLTYNKIGEDGAKAVSAALKDLENISTLNLDLAENNIGNEGAKAVSIALNKLKKISILNLIIRYNNIGEEGAIAVSTSLKELKQMLSLDFNISSNNYSEGVREIFKQIASSNLNYYMIY